MTLAIAENGLDHILVDLVVLFALCILVVVCFHRLRIPPIAGFLAVGALMGPNALGLIHQVEIVEFLAEIGIVVLLFTVGMELSLRDLFKMRRSLLVGGGLQIGLTIGLGASGALLGDWNGGRRSSSGSCCPCRARRRSRSCCRIGANWAHRTVGSR